MLKEFDELVRQRKELVEWWKLATTVAEYDRAFYVLRVDVAKPSMVAFCGQQTAGGQNYHDAPSFFLDVVKREIECARVLIVKQAYEKELARLTSEITKLKERIQDELNVTF